ncbi:hypothetical protein [Bradyrhizobium sp. USDA 4506]
MLLIFGGAYLILHFFNSKGGQLPTITTLAVGGGGAGLVASLIGKASSTAAVIKKGYATIKEQISGPDSGGFGPAVFWGARQHTLGVCRRNNP